MSQQPGDPVPARVPGTYIPVIDDVPRATPGMSIDRPAMISRTVLQLSNVVDLLERRVKTLRQAIERALQDEESGKGWGPDTTTCAYLRQALKDTE